MPEDIDSQFFTAANILSLLRILLIPVFIVLMIQHRTISAFIVFLFASLTDLLDGIAARIWKQKTRIGTYLDPAADKLLMASSFIVLSLPAVSIPNTIPLWLMIVVLLRDIYIVFGVLVFIKLTGKTEIKPSILGKSCTVVEMGVLILVLFYNALGRVPSFFPPLYVFTLGLTLLSAAHYTLTGLRIYSRTAQRKGKE